MTFLELLDDVFASQTCVLKKYAQDAFGTKTLTSATTVSCFAFYGTLERKNRETQYTETQGWQVILPTSVASLISEGDEISNIRDKDGSQVLALGTVVSLATYHHWDDGQQFYLASLGKN